MYVLVHVEHLIQYDLARYHRFFLEFFVGLVMLMLIDFGFVVAAEYELAEMEMNLADYDSPFDHYNPLDPVVREYKVNNVDGNEVVKMYDDIGMNDFGN
jgi:hypothetical protein